MLMLLAPVAVSVLGVVARGAKQWRAGKEIKNNDTAVVTAMPTIGEWEVMTTSNNANEVRGALNKAIERAEIVGPELLQKGVMT